MTKNHSPTFNHTRFVVRRQNAAAAGSRREFTSQASPKAHRAGKTPESRLSVCADTGAISGARELGLIQPFEVPAVGVGVHKERAVVAHVLEGREVFGLGCRGEAGD